jgi:pSer/pThr/pTyr-binding forkhead associated (FHA) protein
MNLPPAELVPVGGGDAIPLVRPRLTVGRRESCDICLRFPNISGQHCELELHEGVWFIRDLNSTNGTKVNGQPVTKRMLQPGDEVGIGPRRFTIRYQLPEGHQSFQNFLEEEDLSVPLLEKAGLMKKPGSGRPSRRLPADER